MNFATFEAMVVDTVIQSSKTEEARTRKTNLDQRLKAIKKEQRERMKEAKKKRGTRL